MVKDEPTVIHLFLLISWLNEKDRLKPGREFISSDILNQQNYFWKIAVETFITCSISFTSEQQSNLNINKEQTLPFHNSHQKQMELDS